MHVLRARVGFIVCWTTLVVVYIRKRKGEDGPEQNNQATTCVNPFNLHPLSIARDTKEP